MDNDKEPTYEKVFWMRFACDYIHSDTYDGMEKYLQSKTRKKGGLVYCDVGCGSSLNYFNKIKGLEKLNYIGVDISFETLKAVNKNENSDLIVADMRQLPLRPDSVDVVSTFWTFIHIPENDRIKAIHELSRVSRDSIFFYDPEPDNQFVFDGVVRNLNFKRIKHESLQRYKKRHTEEDGKTCHTTA